MPIMATPAGYRRAILAAWAVLCHCSAARADVFRLESGGQVEGEWLNRAEQPLTRYLVRTADGVTLTLGVHQVKEAVRQSPAEVEYRRLAPAAADTIEGQWCAGRMVPQERPDAGSARRTCGGSSSSIPTIRRPAVRSAISS